MAADAPQSHEYFSPQANPSQNLYPQQQQQQLDQFARLGSSYTPQQQQQQQQQRWAQQLRANQYAAAMKQKQQMAGLGLVSMHPGQQQGQQHPGQQHPGMAQLQRTPSHPSGYPQQYNPAAGFPPNYAANSPTNTFPQQNNSAGFGNTPNQPQQQFNFPGTPTHPNPQHQSFPNFANGTPNSATREMTGTPAPGPRDFPNPNTPQRDFSTNPNASGTPQRDFSNTPAPGAGPGRDFSSTPQRDFGSGGNNHGGTPGPQPHAFLPPNRSMAGTPHGNPNTNPMGQASRTGTPIVRPGTAMSGSGSASAGGFGGDGGMQRGSQPPPTPKMGMGMNGMSIPNLPNPGMNMGMMGGVESGMGGANGGMMGMGAGNGMGANMNVPGNTNMGMGMNPGANTMSMSGGPNMNMALPGGPNMNMPGGNMSMPGGNMNMPGGNMNIPGGGMNMPGAGNMNMNVPGGGINMPGAGNMSPTKPMGLGINVGGGMNALGMGGMGGMNGMGMNPNGMAMGANGMANAGMGMGMSGMGMGMGGMMGMNGLSGGVNTLGAGTSGAGVNPALGGANPGLGGMNPGLGGVNAGLGGVNAGLNPALGVAPALGGPNPALGSMNSALGVNPALGVNSAMARANPALGGIGPSLGGVSSSLAAGMNPVLSGGMNPGLAGGMNPGLVGGIQPPKLSRRIVSSAGPLPASPTKAPATAALPLPPGLNPQTTLVTALPLLKDESDVTHGGALPEVTRDEMRNVKHWMERDVAFQDVYSRVREKRAEEENALRTTRAGWWEVDEAGPVAMAGKFHIWWPADQRKIKERKMKILGRKDLDVTKLVKAGAAMTQPEMLVPIRIEIDHDHYRLRDAFTWNLNDPVITPDVFAQCLCDDFQISSAAVVQAVAKSINEQLIEHRAHIVEVPSGPKRELIQGTIEEKSEEWWKQWRQKVADGTVGVKDEVEDTLANDEDNTVSEELRVLVKLDVIVGTMNLTDQFEWDINNPDNSPEEFAEIYCRDLGLGGEFKTAVAHSIREQASVYQKSLFLVGHPFDGSAVADDELRTAMLPPIDHSFRFDRTLLEQFTPQLNVLQEGEIERNEREREKELKRKRRQTRGRRGVALPDREPQKTHRTPIGFAEVEITPAQQAAQQQPTVSFRRAAAAAASLTIANLAANENGTPVPTSMHTIEKERLTPVIPQQQQQQIQPPKPKRQRTGIMQPPPLPKSVFNARAGAGAIPTAATGLEPAEASASRVEFGDGAPEPPVSPGGGHGSEAVDMDGQAAMLKRVLEKEGAESTEGLHPNMIDGTWHCSNCGCPDSMAVGRRKGPLGQGTMCGECGKYWHKHRKPRPVEYSTSLEYHTNLKKAAKMKKRGTKGNANANANPSPSKPSSARESERPPASELLANGRDSLSPSPPPQKPSPLPFMDPGSPDSTIGPDSPKTQSTPLPPTADLPTTPSVAEQPPPPAPKANGNTTTIPTRPPLLAMYSSERAIGPNGEGVPLPQWMLDCLAATQMRYPHDRIDVILKPRPQNTEEPAIPEFRLKCLDCPGKLYTPGPEQTLTNFEVHLKNRTHRSNVNRRVAAEANAADAAETPVEMQAGAQPASAN